MYSKPLTFNSFLIFLDLDKIDFKSLVLPTTLSLLALMADKNKILND